MLPILNQSLWRDEAFSLLLAAKELPEIITLTTKDANAPLYYFLLHFWLALFGSGESTVRTLSLVFFILTALVGFLVMKEITKHRLVSFLAGLAILLNPFLIQYAFEARPYTLLAFLTIATIYFFIMKRYILASIFLALAIFTHNFSIFTFLAFLAVWLRQRFMKERLDLVEGAKLLLLPIFALVIWGSVIWNQWVKVTQSFWIPPITGDMFLDLFEKFFKGTVGVPLQNQLFLFTLILFALTVSYWVANLKNDSEKEKLTIILVVAILPIILTYVVSVFWAPIYHERFLISSLPLLIVFAVYSLYQLAKLKSETFRIFIAVVSFLYLFTALQVAEQITKTSTKPAINHAVQQILDKAQMGDIIISENELNFLETKFYVQKSGKNIPVFVHKPSGEIVWYIGGILFKPEEVIRELPKNTRIWQISPNGEVKLISN